MFLVLFPFPASLVSSSLSVCFVSKAWCLTSLVLPAAPESSRPLINAPVRDCFINYTKPCLFTPSVSDHPFTHCGIVCMSPVVKYYYMLCSASAQFCPLCLRFTCICFPVFLPHPGRSLFALLSVKSLPLPAMPSSFCL